MNDVSRERGIERNITLYPLYQVLFNLYFWLPVFFLYFSEHLSLGAVLRLEAIYYVTVVVLEVPSGYFSDRVGRRATLLVGAVALVASYALFLAGSLAGDGVFAIFALGQVCLAAGISFNSGTDTTLHFDSLSAAGRGGEYGAREANAHRLALLGGSAAALAGGVAATWDLRLAYALSLLAAAATLGVALRFVEPAHADAAPPPGFIRQLGACLGQLANRSLAWLLAFAVLMIVLNHVPYEFYQPYLDLLLERRRFKLPGTGTPLVTGVVTACTALVASWAAARSIRLRDRFGLAPTLLATTALQVAIIAAMGAVLHEVVLLLILARSVPGAIMQPPLRAAITPQLPRALRATYLSFQSLAGRLAFAATLALLSLGSRPGEPPDWFALSWMSLACAAAGAAGLLALAATARACLPEVESPA